RAVAGDTARVAARARGGRCPAPAGEEQLGGLRLIPPPDQDATGGRGFARARRVNSQTPPSTSAVPAACQGVKASPSTKTARQMVTTGETLPTTAVRSGPISPMAPEMQ